MELEHTIADGEDQSCRTSANLKSLDMQIKLPLRICIVSCRP